MVHSYGKMKHRAQHRRDFPGKRFPAAWPGVDTHAPWGLFLFLIFMTGRSALAQEARMAVNEHVYACTDRTFYVAGETILFSAAVKQAGDGESAGTSRILYAELITPEGTKITGRKFTLNGARTQGCLSIPGEAITGYYFIRFYTRWMRNFPAEEYHYILLKIINAYRPEILPEKKAEKFIENQPGTYIPAQAGQDTKIRMEKNQFHPGEKISVTLAGAMFHDLPWGWCVSVVPEGSFNEYPFRIGKSAPVASAATLWPETQGLTLSGHLMQKETGKPLPDAYIHLSVIGDRDIRVTLTDSAGSFRFVLPEHTGKKDIFLCAAEMPEITPEIFIDNDFCTRPVDLLTPAFTLTEAEMQLALQLSANEKVARIFEEQPSPVGEVVPADATSFYGTPTQLLTLEKFIDLPTLEDYFTELPLIVKVRKEKGKKGFRFQSDVPGLAMYEPLVLVDWVAVSDMKKILAMSPAAIDRIEVVDALFVKGDITYGGIVSFISKKNDFAGIDLPASGTFINYRFTEVCPEIPAPHAGSALPDARNTLFREPGIHPPSALPAEFTFIAPDTPGRYMVVVTKMSGGAVFTPLEVIR